MISSWLLPFVSGTNRIVNKAQQIHIPANRKIFSWNSSNSSKNGENCIALKAQNTVMQSDTPVSLILSGMISDMSISGIGRIPNATKKMAKEKLARGIQLNFPTSKLRDPTIMYTPKTVRLKAVPVFDTTSNN